MKKTSLSYADVAIGDALPEMQVPISVSLIVAGALASQDYTPVHHDKAAAQAAGMQDVFMNILTTNGLVSRFVTEWAGIDARLRNLSVKLGAPNLPGDTMTLSGEVIEKDDARGLVTVKLRGSNAWGDHVTGTVKVALAQGA